MSQEGGGDMEKVYTLHEYSDAMDYGRGTMRIPMYGEYDIKSSIGRQPLNLTVVTRGGDVLYDGMRAIRAWTAGITSESDNEKEEEGTSYSKVVSSDLRSPRGELDDATNSGERNRHDAEQRVGVPWWRKSEDRNRRRRASDPM
mmetsp:Transcript_32144/g.77720  ORF Transcript_32144/g.77720 Transcript_32144/m.77720 type:complete len:144 (+) Transcript_32144:1101-1532(+)